MYRDHVLVNALKAKLICAGYICLKGREIELV